MTVAPIIKKVPGAPVKFEHEKDGYVNLSLMNKTELLDLLERENKILNNKKFVDKLPDKGGKIKDFRDKVENELKRRNEQDKLCHLLSNLDVSDSKEALNKLEWTGDTNSPAQNEVKCDTENETNPLRIIATHSGTTISREKVLKIEEPLSLIKPSDTEDAHTIMTSVDLYAKQLCEKFDKTQEVERKKFYPNKTLNKTFTRTMSHRKEPEISSAYVPKSISGQAKLISLEESITVHQEQMKHLKEVEMQHAIERLIKKAEIKMKQPKNLINAYREQHNEDSEDEESDVFEENSEEENEKESISNLSDVD